MAFLSRKNRYPGTKLVVAIDVGTTNTAASYCLIDDEGSATKFQEVNKWPMQDSYGDTKIPSVLYYDENHVPRLHGAETEDEDSLLEAETNGWHKVKWWKLQLRPEYLDLPPGIQIEPLPNGLTADDVFRHQFVYVKNQVRDFIKRAHGFDERVMAGLEASMYLVITVPNGWEGKHQHRMRKAALSAGFFDQQSGHRIKIVSEGEAAIHYALNTAVANQSQKLRVGDTFLVCDAGGGTTDIGIYRLKSENPVILDELTSPNCCVAGGTFVNQAAKSYICAQVRGSGWDRPECITEALKDFEKNAKRKFNGTAPFYSVKLDNNSASDDKRGIQRGRLRIPRERMESFFDPLINIVVQGLNASVSSSSWVVDSIVLVGGFAESDYVYSKLKCWAQNHALNIGKPDGSFKAIAHGGLNWYMGSSVQIRIARFYYGAETDVEYVSTDPDMRGRKKYQNILGEWRVRSGWMPIVAKDTKIRFGDEHNAEFHRHFGENDSLIGEMDILAYRRDTPPAFFHDKGGHLIDGFIAIGTVKADLTTCFKAASASISPRGEKFKTLHYAICLSFDEVEIQARLRWKERGRFKYGDAIIIYDV